MSPRSSWSSTLRTPLGAVAVCMVTAFVVLAAAAPIIFGQGANANNVAIALQGPSSAHLLGTDALGRDVLDRVLVATRTSLVEAAAATAVGFVGGVVLGALPAVLGRRVGRLVVAAINLSLAFPALLLAIFLSIIFGIGSRGAILAIGVASVPGFARLTQTLAASIAGADFVTAARLLRVRRARLMARYVLPNISGPIIINVMLTLGFTLLAFAGLSFLGLGAQPPNYDWGELLSQGLPYIYTNPAAALGPGVAVVLAGASFNLLGDALAKVFGVERDRRSVRRLPSLSPPVESLDGAGSSAESFTDAGALLTVGGMRVAFPGATGWITPVSDVSFNVFPCEIVGIVGESGSGKSLTAMGIGRLVEHPGVVSAAQMTFAGRDLLSMSEPALKSLLGTSLGMVFQDPLSALNPALKVGPQLAEVVQVHERRSKADGLFQAVDRLGAVKLPNPQRRARQYPHELSGGMRQRAVIAMGLMASPKLIVADEPTTALDVTVQRQVLDLLRSVRDAYGCAIILISHDIAVVSQMCRRVLVMYAGRIVEELPGNALLDGAAHPYTRALVASLPDMTTDRSRPLTSIPGNPPDPADLPLGCPFSPRCDFATNLCESERPPLVEFGTSRRVACFHPQIAEAMASAGP